MYFTILRQLQLNLIVMEKIIFFCYIGQYNHVVEFKEIYYKKLCSFIVLPVKVWMISWFANLIQWINYCNLVLKVSKIYQFDPLVFNLVINLISLSFSFSFLIFKYRQFSPFNFRCTFVVKYENNTVLERNFNLTDVLKFGSQILQYNFF